MRCCKVQGGQELVAGAAVSVCAARWAAWLSLRAMDLLKGW